jgi:hypothetical protein
VHLDEKATSSCMLVMSLLEQMSIHSPCSTHSGRNAHTSTLAPFAMHMHVTKGRLRVDCLRDMPCFADTQSL